jgi:hypothetical protein
MPINIQILRYNFRIILSQSFNLPEGESKLDVCVGASKYTRKHKNCLWEQVKNLWELESSK